jgi:hypothetical protein
MRLTLAPRVPATLIPDWTTSDFTSFNQGRSDTMVIPVSKEVALGKIAIYLNEDPKHAVVLDVNGGRVVIWQDESEECFHRNSRTRGSHTQPLTVDLPGNSDQGHSKRLPQYKHRPICWS